MSLLSEDQLRTLYTPSSAAYSTAQLSHNGRKCSRPYDEIESIVGKGSSTSRLPQHHAPQPLFISQNRAGDSDQGDPKPTTPRHTRASLPLDLTKDQAKDTDEEGSISPKSRPSRVPSPLYTSLNPNPDCPHLMQAPAEKYRSMDRETLFKQKCLKAQIKGHPHIYEPLPRGLQLDEIIAQYPNHLHEPLLLEIAEFWTPKEISNTVGPELLRSNTIIKRISAAKIQRNGKMTKGRTPVKAPDRADHQSTSRRSLVAVGDASEPSLGAGLATQSLVVESNASRRTWESQEAALAEDPECFMRIERKRLSSQRSSRMSNPGVSLD